MNFTPFDEASFTTAREKMVRILAEERGIQDQRVLEVMQAIPRHLFVDEALANQAYGEATLPIGEGQTLSQPFTVAWMTEALALKGREQVLEIGTGSGYQTAVLAKLCSKVFTVERLTGLAEQARRRLRRMNLHNVIFRVGDGSLGWPDADMRFFDRIIVTAGAPAVPKQLVRQLNRGGILLVPEGEAERQQLVRIVSLGGGGMIRREVLGPCRFVPLVGEEGWPPEPARGTSPLR